MIRGSFVVFRTAGLVAVLAAFPMRAMAQITVDPGWDLYATNNEETTYLTAHFKGDPLGSYNFGGSIGTKNTALTDTIIQRSTQASVPAANFSTSIPVVIAAFQLESVGKTTLDGSAPLANYYITLSKTKASTGTYNITFLSAAGGTFSDTLNLNVDIRSGSLNGNIIGSKTFNIDSTTVAWNRIPPANSVQISGVNLNLNGINNAADFWTPGGDPLATPEPSAFCGLGLGFGLLFVKSRRRHRRTAL